MPTLSTRAERSSRPTRAVRLAAPAAPRPRLAGNEAPGVVQRAGAVELVLFFEPLQRLRRDVRVDARDDARVERAFRHLPSAACMPDQRRRHGRRERSRSRRSACGIRLPSDRREIAARDPAAARDAAAGSPKREGDAAAGVLAAATTGASACSIAGKSSASKRSRPQIDVEPRRDGDAHRLAGRVDHVRMLGEAADARAHRRGARPRVAPDRRRCAEAARRRRVRLHVRPAPVRRGSTAELAAVQLAS